MFNLNNKSFKALQNSENGDVGGETVFHYYQENFLITGNYSGGTIKEGNLSGRVVDTENFEIVYNHICSDGSLKTGHCQTRVQEIDGKIHLFEKWKWTCGDESEGTSELIEI